MTPFWFDEKVHETIILALPRCLKPMMMGK